MKNMQILKLEMTNIIKNQANKQKNMSMKFKSSKITNNIMLNNIKT